MPSWSSAFPDFSSAIHHTGWSSNFSLKSSFISFRAPDLCSAHRSRRGSKVQAEMPAIYRLSPTKPSCTMGTLGREPGPWPSVPQFEPLQLQQRLNQHSSGSCCLHKWAQSQSPESCAKLLSELETVEGEGIFRDDSTWKKQCVEAAPTTKFCSATCSPSVKKA